MTEFSLSIIQWYRLNKRDLPWRKTNDPYKIWLSEVILQQTRVDQGIAYYNKFIKNYPTIDALSKAKEQDILNDWQGLGYYSRARNLHAAAKEITNNHNGVFPKTFDEIIQLKGVGQYTASAIASFAFGENKAVVDGNVYRVLSRVFDIETPIDSSAGKKEFQELANALIDQNNPGEHNQAIMEFGAIICTPKPNCTTCILMDKCLSYANKTIALRPKKSKKTKIRDRYFHYLIYNFNHKTIIQKRSKKDIWQNMYEFPLVEQQNDLEWTTLRPIKISVETKHILSHQRIHTKFYHFNQPPSKLAPNWEIIDQTEIQNYPLPRLIDKYLEEVGFD